jgi:ferredoxin
VAACPYGAIWWNEELNLPQAWTFDAHLLDRGWSAPRCVQSCPTGALRAIKATDEEMAALAGAERLEPLQPELGTHPRVYYRNLYRYTKLFVGGSVSAERNGVADCLAGASVELLQAGRVHCAARSTLPANSSWTPSSHAAASGSCAWPAPVIPRSLAVTLVDECVVIDEIPLQPA